MIYFSLIIEFFKIGLFSVGGGLATIPFLIELISTRGWYTLDTLNNMITISESTPGPIGVNMATYVGFNVSGIPGAIIATLSLVLPSYIIICIISKFYKKYRNNKIINETFTGIRAAVCGLILVVTLTIIKTTIIESELSFKNIKYTHLILMLIIFGLMNIKILKKIHPVIWIFAGGILGVVFKL